MKNQAMILVVWCFILLGVVAAIGNEINGTELPAPPVVVFDPVHADACRVLHAIAKTKRQRAEAMLACQHRNPDEWLGFLNQRTATFAKEWK